MSGQQAADAPKAAQPRRGSDCVKVSRRDLLRQDKDFLEEVAILRTWFTHNTVEEEREQLKLEVAKCLQSIKNQKRSVTPTTSRSSKEQSIWWSEELTQLRREAIAARRKYTRYRRRRQKDEETEAALLSALKESKQALGDAINKAKIETGCIEVRTNNSLEMADIPEVTTSSPTELLAAGRRHLAVRDYSAAAEALAKACEALAKEHGDTADHCAEAYLWYGKALLGLSREESGVLGDGMPGSTNAEEEEDNEEGENGEEDQNGDAETEKNVESNGKVEKNEAESTTKDEEPGSSTAAEADSAEPETTTNGEAEESEVNLDNEDDVDNLQLAWEMLDLARSILHRRVEDGGGDAARALLADVHLALGEVALESETYDKAVTDMQSCLELQKELYRSDDRRIAETHYQIGLANSLASNFEDAITHFKNAANILETRIKTLENPAAATEDATVKKFSSADPFYSVEGEIKELKELLPEIQEKIQDMMDYKAETIKRVRETLCSANGQGSSHTNGAGSSSSEPKPAASDISHLIKRKRKSSESDADSSAPKRINT